MLDGVAKTPLVMLRFFKNVYLLQVWCEQQLGAECQET